MMTMMLVEHRNCDEIARLSVSKFVTEDNRDRLSSLHTLAQFGPHSANDSANQRDHRSFFVAIRLHHARSHLSARFGRGPLANRFDLQSRALRLLRRQG